MIKKKFFQALEQQKMSSCLIILVVFPNIIALFCSFSILIGRILDKVRGRFLCFVWNLDYVKCNLFNEDSFICHGYRFRIDLLQFFLTVLMSTLWTSVTKEVIYLLLLFPTFCGTKLWNAVQCMHVVHL